MKVLALDQFSDPGGAQQVLVELLPAIAARGWQATIGLPGRGELFGRVRQLGFETARVACGPYRSGEKSAGDLFRFAMDVPRLAAQVRRLGADADLIYVNGPRLLPGVALSGVKAPVLFHAHSYLPPGRTRDLAGRALRNMDAAVVAACEFVAAPWREWVPAERVQVIYNGVAGPEAPVWRGIGRTIGRTIGCIGRIAPEKGQVEFVHAAQLILPSLPDARFVIHGAALFAEAAALRYAEEVRALADGLPVEFAGWAADVNAALAGLDLLLAPCMGQEATTRVILEAFAAGVPVIAFPSGGIPEVLEDGRTGWLAGSIEEMAGIAVEVLRNPERAAEVSAVARREWELRFTRHRFQEQVLDCMEQSSRCAAPHASQRRVARAV